MPEPEILLIEDDAELRALVARGLQEEGFAVTVAINGSDAMERVTESAPDALIIDIGLPDADGRDICQALRARGVHCPVLFLTARDAVTDRLSGFRAGGDDYVTKPFHLAEVAERIRSLLKRAGVDPVTEYRGLRLDPTAHELIAGERRIALTPTEFRLIAVLASGPGETASRLELVRAAWPDGAVVHDNTLDVYVARLRRKLEALPGVPEIETVHGLGYRLQ
jgi:two-component system, OmpR family, response regulator